MSDLRAILLALAVLATGLVLLSTPAAAQDDDKKEESESRVGPYRFKFEMDDLPPRVREFAMHVDPPDLSELDSFRLRLGEPLRSWARNTARFAEEQIEIAKFEAESHEMAREARQAEGAERRELERQLRDKLDQIFNRKMELRRERIEHLEERLREEREQYRVRGNTRESMIDQRLRHLMGEDDELEW